MNAVIWRVGTVGSPHAIIVGIPGQGKSVTTRRIIAEFQNSNVATLALDFHGDLAAHSVSGVRTIDVAVEGMPFSPFEVRNENVQSAKSAALEIADIMRSVVNLGEIQRSNVYKALLNCYESLGWMDGMVGHSLPSMKNFVAQLRLVEASTRGQNAEARLLDITEFDLFRDADKHDFEPLTCPGSVFDLSNMGSEAIKLAAGGFLLRKIYNSMFHWGQTDRLRLAIVLDEAHLLSRDPTIPKLMKEGRKFGLSLVLVSQSLDDFRQEVGENAGLKIAFRTNNPSSKKVAALLGGNNTAALAMKIERLQVGEAYVSTAGMDVPVMTKMLSQD